MMLMIMCPNTILPQQTGRQIALKRFLRSWLKCQVLDRHETNFRQDYGAEASAVT